VSVSPSPAGKGFKEEKVGSGRSGKGGGGQEGREGDFHQSSAGSRMTEIHVMGG